MKRTVTFIKKVNAIKAMGRKARELGFTTINEAFDAGHDKELREAYEAELN